MAVAAEAEAAEMGLVPGGPNIAVEGREGVALLRPDLGLLLDSWEGGREMEGEEGEEEEEEEDVPGLLPGGEVGRGAAPPPPPLEEEEEEEGKPPLGLPACSLSPNPALLGGGDDGA
jgi:hypothetical protein